MACGHDARRSVADLCGVLAAGEPPAKLVGAGMAAGARMLGDTIWFSADGCTAAA